MNTPQEKKSEIKIVRKKKTVFPQQVKITHEVQPMLEKSPIAFRTPTKVTTRASSKHSPSSTISPSTEAVMLQKVPKFLQILYQMLERESDEIIAWSNEGTAFQVKDIKQLEASVLPNYFKHQKMSSFQRQLNYFSFRKLTKSKTNTCTFMHPYFSEHEPEKLSLITKKNCASRGVELFSPENQLSKSTSTKKAPTLKKRLPHKVIILPRKTSTSATCSSNSGADSGSIMMHDKENQPPHMEREEQDFKFFNMNSLLTSENQMRPFDLTENLPDQASCLAQMEREEQDFRFFNMNSLLTSENQMRPFDLTENLPDQASCQPPSNDQPHFLPVRAPMMNGDIFMLHQLTNNMSSPHQSSTTFWSDALLDFDLSLNAADFL